MNDLEDSKMLDLMYLTNPNTLEKMKLLKKDKTHDETILKKNKKLVMKITEQILNSDITNKSDNVLHSFYSYFEKILEDEYMKKKSKIIQAQYDKKKKKKKKVVNMDVTDIDVHLLKKEKKPKKVDLDKFVKKKKVKKKVKVHLPKKQNFDFTNEKNI